MRTEDILILQQVKGCGPVFLRQNIDRLIPNDVFDFVKKHKPEQVPFLEQYQNDAKRYMFEADKNNAKIISFLSSEYPSQLKTIPNAPAVIYAKGNTDLLKRVVAIIGTRHSSLLGNRIAERLGAYFSQQCSLCNGLVEGIDEHVIKVDDKILPNVVGIISGGIDYENTCTAHHQKNIEAVIEAGGLIVSSFFPGQKENSYSGSIASNLQAQISHGLILVQSSVTGGSKYTMEAFSKLPRPIGVIEYNKSSEYETEVFGANRMIIEKGKLGVSEFVGVKDIKKMKTSHILPIRSISDYETFVKYMFSDNQSLF